MKTQTNVKEEITKDMINLATEFAVGNTPRTEFIVKLSQSLDRLEKSVREETERKAFGEVMSMLPSSDGFYLKFMKRYGEVVLTSQKEEEQKIACKFSSCNEVVSLHEVYCKQHMYLRKEEDK